MALTVEADHVEGGVDPVRPVGAFARSDQGDAAGREKRTETMSHGETFRRDQVRARSSREPSDMSP